MKFIYFKEPQTAPQLLDFDVNLVFLNEPVNKQGNRKVLHPYYLHQGVRIPLKLQTPQMYAPFEIDYPRFGDEKKYYKQFSLSFKGEEESTDLIQFRKVVSAIDQRFIDILTENAAQWFGNRGKKIRSREQIESNYTNLIKDGWSEKKQVKYPDNIQVRCTIRSKLLQAAFFDDEGNTIISEEDIRLAQSDCVAVVHIGALWVVQSGWYPRFEANQVQIFENHKMDRDFGICVNSDEEK